MRKLTYIFSFHLGFIISSQAHQLPVTNGGTTGAVQELQQKVEAMEAELSKN